MAVFNSKPEAASDRCAFKDATFVFTTKAITVTPHGIGNLLPLSGIKLPVFKFCGNFLPRSNY